MSERNYKVVDYSALVNEFGFSPAPQLEAVRPVLFRAMLYKTVVIYAIPKNDMLYFEYTVPKKSGYDLTAIEDEQMNMVFDYTQLKKVIKALLDKGAVVEVNQ